MTDPPAVPRRGASLEVRAWAIRPRVLRLSCLVALILLVPLVAGFLLGGAGAAIAIGMGYVALTRPALTLRPRYALALALPAAMAAAVAVALRGQPLAAACFVALCCLLVAPANQLQDGLLAGLPSIAAVLAGLPGSQDPAVTAAGVLVGGAALVGVAAWAPRMASLPGIGQARAWRHAAVMALTVGPVVYLTQALGLPHGYWMALTLTVVLRPFDDQTWRKAWQRILGTLLGVVLSLLLAATLPLWAIVIALGATMVLTIAYSAQGDYLRQVVFLTPAAVLLGSTASLAVVATERMIATVAGALLAGAVALLLAKYDQRANGAVEVS